MRSTRPPAISITGLRTVKLLAGLSDDALASVAQRMTWRQFKPGQCVVSRDARDTDVYFVVSGLLRATAISQAGRQLIYRDLHPGEWFGDLAAIDGRLRSVDVITVSVALLASMRADDFLALIAENPSVAEGQIRHLVEWVRALTERLYDLSTLDVQQRVHAELLRLAKAVGVVDNVARITPLPTHAEMASVLSTYREQVTREVSRLAKLGVVERQGDALIVRNVADLERIVSDRIAAD